MNIKTRIAIAQLKSILTNLAANESLLDIEAAEGQVVKNKESWRDSPVYRVGGRFASKDQIGSTSSAEEGDGGGETDQVLSKLQKNMEQAKAEIAKRAEQAKQAGSEAMTATEDAIADGKKNISTISGALAKDAQAFSTAKAEAMGEGLRQSADRLSKQLDAVAGEGLSELGNAIQDEATKRYKEFEPKLKDMTSEEFEQTLQDELIKLNLLHERSVGEELGDIKNVDDVKKFMDNHAAEAAVAGAIVGGAAASAAIAIAPAAIGIAAFEAVALGTGVPSVTGLLADIAVGTAAATVGRVGADVAIDKTVKDKDKAKQYKELAHIATDMLAMGVASSATKSIVKNSGKIAENVAVGVEKQGVKSAAQTAENLGKKYNTAMRTYGQKTKAYDDLVEQANKISRIGQKTKADKSAARTLQKNLAKAKRERDAATKQLDTIGKQFNKAYDKSNTLAFSQKTNQAKRANKAAGVADEMADTKKIIHLEQQQEILERAIKQETRPDAKKKLIERAQQMAREKQVLKSKLTGTTGATAKGILTKEAGEGLASVSESITKADDAIANAVKSAQKLTKQTNASFTKGKALATKNHQEFVKQVDNIAKQTNTLKSKSAQLKTLQTKIAEAEDFAKANLLNKPVAKEAEKLAVKAAKRKEQAEKIRQELAAETEVLQNQLNSLRGVKIDNSEFISLFDEFEQSVATILKHQDALASPKMQNLLAQMGLQSKQNTEMLDRARAELSKEGKQVRAMLKSFTNK